MTKLLLFQCPICQVETTADVTEIVQCQVCGETLKRKPAMVSIDYEKEIERLRSTNRELKEQLDIATDLGEKRFQECEWRRKKCLDYDLNTEELWLARKEVDKLKDQLSRHDSAEYLAYVQAAEIQKAEILRLTDELERMKIRCILKLDPDSPIQKLNFGTEPKEGEAE